MIDPRAEQLIPIGEAAAHIPGRPHRATIWRWIQRGIRGVVLDSVRVGGRRYTSVEAIHRFILAFDGRKATASQTDSRRRNNAIERAMRQLDARNGDAS